MNAGKVQVTTSVGARAKQPDAQLQIEEAVIPRRSTLPKAREILKSSKHSVSSSPLCAAGFTIPQPNSKILNQGQQKHR